MQQRGDAVNLMDVGRACSTCRRHAARTGRWQQRGSPVVGFVDHLLHTQLGDGQPGDQGGTAAPGGPRVESLDGQRHRGVDAAVPADLQPAGAASRPRWVRPRPVHGALQQLAHAVRSRASGRQQLRPPALTTRSLQPLPRLALNPTLTNLRQPACGRSRPVAQVQAPCCCSCRGVPARLPRARPPRFATPPPTLGHAREAADVTAQLGVWEDGDHEGRRPAAAK